jgi:hypothetical protein
MPTAGPVTGNAERLHVPRQRSGQTKPHPADLRDPYRGPLPVKAADVPVTAAPPCYSEPLMLPSLAPGRAEAVAVEEIRHRLREVTKGLLLNRLRPRSQPRVLGSCSGEFPALLQVTGRGLPTGTPPGMLLNREVPYVPGIRAVPQQTSSLLAGGLKTVPRHANILARK